MLEILLKHRKKLIALKKENETYVILNNFEMQKKYFKAKKLLKKTEKAIFKILENE